MHVTYLLGTGHATEISRDSTGHGLCVEDPLIPRGMDSHVAWGVAPGLWEPTSWASVPPAGTSRGGSAPKAFQCEECPRSYSSKYALVRHARQHTNSHLRACPFCGRTSTRADIIRVHMTNCVKKYIRTIEETALQLQSQPDTVVSQDPDSYLLAITRLAAENEAAKEKAAAAGTSPQTTSVGAAGASGMSDPGFSLD